MERCSSGKRMYASQRVAEDELIEAWTRYDYPPGTGPIAVYRCEDCGNYHLTSKGPINERLHEVIASGRIQRQKEADRWSDKWKRR